ncbi:MAG: YHS domain-containing protein [Solirubrobacteraceae bacterium]
MRCSGSRRGATDPTCGMKVDRAKAVCKSLAGETFYFCRERCLHALEADPAHRDPGVEGVSETLHAN